ncbi:M64 family metallopeptidase [Sulfitobacter sp. 915]|uniref:M64 family metallopeptidase n=1 Tax=Sulfitobacter sp. 915 TaxID=3368558 RepID=UPI003746CB03
MSVRTLTSNGSPNNRIDIIILGDGYRLSEISTTFSSHAENLTKYIFGESTLTEPFGFYSNFFNVHLIDVVSEQSGADDPANGISVDTAMNATYRFDGSTDRLLYIDSDIANSIMARELSGTGIEADMQVVTVNSEKYGGGGGYYSVYAGGNRDALEVALHEIGHSFAGLADEYGGDTGAFTGVEPTEVNVTKDPTGAKWSHWIGYDQPGIGTIGAFEGGRYFDRGIYRPSDSSKMNVLNNPFDAVSREAFILQFYDIVDPLDDYAFKDAAGTIENPDSLWVDTIDDEIIEVEWFVDGNFVLRGPSNVTMQQLGLSSGDYTIKAKAFDPTDWVRQPDRSDLEQEVIWNVSIDNTGITLRGTISDDILIGTGRDDVILGAAGDDHLDGGSGTDTAVYSGSQESYTLTLSSTAVDISDRRIDADGTDQLINIELLDFDTGGSGSTFDLSKFAGPAGLSQDAFESFIELYIAYFNRAPDAVGLNFWGTAFANGTTLEEIATFFIDQEETRATYPDSLSNADFATAVYNNVLGRIPDEAGYDFWVGVLDSGDRGRDQFILSVLEGVQEGSPDRLYLDSKIDVGAYFAVHKGMSNVSNASSAMALFDGTQAGTDKAITAIDAFYASALDPTEGEFLIQVVGILDDPFANT